MKGSPVAGFTTSKAALPFTNRPPISIMAFKSLISLNLASPLSLLEASLAPPARREMIGETASEGARRRLNEVVVAKGAG